MAKLRIQNTPPFATRHIRRAYTQRQHPVSTSSHDHYPEASCQVTNMTSVDEPGSVTLGVHSTTGAPTRPTVTDAPPTPSATPTTLDEPFVTNTPSIPGMTLDNAIHSTPTETTSPKWHRAAHAVLSTNELLCNIITHLPLKDIVAATGICKAWRSAIAADSAVQKALFLKPVEVKEVLVEDRLLLAFDKSESIDINKCTVVGQLHPFAQKLCGSIKFRAAQSHALPLPRGRWRGCYMEGVSIFGHDHPDGSWRDMFLTQPPCTRAYIEVYGLSKYDYDTPRYVEALESGFSLENDHGVKLGELYDSIACRCRQPRLSVRTTVRKYVVEQIDDSDRTKCVVQNGQVCWPEQLPDLPFTGCDAFGIPPHRGTDRGSWAGLPCYYGGHRQASDPPQQGDGELEDAGDDANKRWWEIPLWAPRVNAYMSSRAGMHEDRLIAK